jgi:ABC-type polysaccharide/polyol phosphate transport system ATPase subunit
MSASRSREPAIECAGVAKRFYVYSHHRSSLREWFVHTLLRRPAERRGPSFRIHGVSFRIAKGEAVALIGPNGAGKSSMLRLMAGIYVPSEGFVRTVGRVGSVIELGTGFHQELSGLENVRLYGAILGLDDRRLAERLDAIVTYAEIGDFIGTPVKYYSSGMRARLAFAVAFHSDPDILLLDETMSVGDAVFQERCLETLRGFHRRGGTLVLATHDLEMVPQICSRAVWVEGGTVRADGPAFEIVELYRAAAVGSDLSVAR